MLPKSRQLNSPKQRLETIGSSDSKRKHVFFEVWTHNKHLRMIYIYIYYIIVYSQCILPLHLIVEVMFQNKISLPFPPSRRPLFCLDLWDPLTTPTNPHIRSTSGSTGATTPNLGSCWWFAPENRPKRPKRKPQKVCKNHPCFFWCEWMIC